MSETSDRSTRRAKSSRNPSSRVSPQEPDGPPERPAGAAYVPASPDRKDEEAPKAAEPYATVVRPSSESFSPDFAPAEDLFAGFFPEQREHDKTDLASLETSD